MTSTRDSGPTITVLISGDFERAYRMAIPSFEQGTGIKIETLSGASQGRDPKTIRYQLDHGAEVDVVICPTKGCMNSSTRG